MRAILEAPARMDEGDDSHILARHHLNCNFAGAHFGVFQFSYSQKHHSAASRLFITKLLGYLPFPAISRIC